MKAHPWKDGAARSGVGFHCPGCDERHQVTTEAHPNCWSYNGDHDSPTLYPSILVRGVKRSYGEGGDWNGWITTAEGKPVRTVCHSFVTDGRIRFLDDCTHMLAGQTVDLPELEPAP